MRPNVLKQVRPAGEQEALPFKQWVTQHAQRIPGESIEIPAEVPEENARPGYNYREVINRRKAKVASGRVAVDTLPAGSLEVGSRAAGAAEGEESDEPDFPYGLTEEQFADLRETWEDEKAEEIEARCEREREEAYEEGYAEASEEAEEQMLELTQILGAGMEEIEGRWSEFIRDNEPLLGKLAFEIAERILSASLPEDIYEGVTAAIHDAVDELAGTTRTDVTLHPADFMRLKETGLLEQMEETYEGLHWHSDPELEQRGDWIVETPGAAIRHLQAELLDDVKRTLELPQ